MSSATARLNAFSCGYRDAVPLTGVQHQKALSRPVSVFIKTGRHVGGTGSKMRRFAPRPFVRTHEDDESNYQYDYWQKRLQTRPLKSRASSSRLFANLRQFACLDQLYFPPMLTGIRVSKPVAITSSACPHTPCRRRDNEPPEYSDEAEI